MSNNYIVYPDELYHYGVKGMKWGVRKDDVRSAAGSVKRQAKKQVKTAYKNNSRTTYKRSKTMTDEQLKTETKRLNAERNYRQAVENDRKDSRSFTHKTLEKVGTIAVATAVSAVGVYAGKKIGDAILNGPGRQMTIWDYMK